MTLDKAIKCYKEKAEGYEQQIREEVWEPDSLSEHNCIKNAEEHRQLAEWLKELKAYQEAHEEMRKLPIVWEFGEGVSRCLSIIENCLKEVNTDADSD